MSLINRYIERNLDDSFSYQYERPNLEVLFTREVWLSVILSSILSLNDYFFIEFIFTHS